MYTHSNITQDLLNPKRPMILGIADQTKKAKEFVDRENACPTLLLGGQEELQGEVEAPPLASRPEEYGGSAQVLPVPSAAPLRQPRGAQASVSKAAAIAAAGFLGTVAPQTPAGQRNI